MQSPNSDHKLINFDYFSIIFVITLIVLSFLIGQHSKATFKCGNPLHSSWQSTPPQGIKPAKYVSKPVRRAFRKLGAHHLSRFCEDCVRVAPLKRQFTRFYDDSGYNKVGIRCLYSQSQKTPTMELLKICMYYPVFIFSIFILHTLACVMHSLYDCKIQKLKRRKKKGLRCHVNSDTNITTKGPHCLL